MSLAFLRLRVTDAARTGLSLFEAQTSWLIVGGLAVTFVVQEVFVWRSPRWRARLREHPEPGGAVELDGPAPDDASALVTGQLPASPTEVADRSTPEHPDPPPTRA